MTRRRTTTAMRSDLRQETDFSDRVDGSEAITVTPSIGPSLTDLATPYRDVAAFHAKFGFPHRGDGLPPAPLPAAEVRLRGAFMLEELAEWFASQGADVVEADLRDLIACLPSRVARDAPVSGVAAGADALVDLAWVVMGTAHFCRLPFEACWDEVRRANMAKERDDTDTTDHHLGVIKPAGWRAPDLWPILFSAATAGR